MANYAVQLQTKQLLKNATNQVMIFDSLETVQTAAQKIEGATSVYVSVPSGIPLSYLQINAGYIYGYDNKTRTQDINNQWNPNNVNRIDQYGNQVTCGQEINIAFAGMGLQGGLSNGYSYTENGIVKPGLDIIMFVCTSALTDEQIILLNTTIANHIANSAPTDQFGIQNSDGTFVMNGDILDLFDTVVAAQEYITLEQLVGAIIRPVVII